MRTVLVAVALLLVVAACGGGDLRSVVGDDPDGEWELVSGTGPDGALPLVDDAPVTLRVGQGELSGRSACNHYFAQVSVDGDRVRIENAGGTEMGCEPEVMALEGAYLTALTTVDRVARNGDQLVFTGPQTELRFTAVPPVPTSDLVGTTWTLETLVTGEVASSVRSETGDPPTLLLAADGTLTATTGCRDVHGRYEVTGAEVVAVEMTADGDCPPDLAEQDDHVVAVLGDGFRATVEQDVLTLSDGDKGLVYRAGGVVRSS